MRIPAHLALLLFVAPAFAQLDRPFGKYLLKICTISPTERTVSCVDPPAPPPRRGPVPSPEAAQTITLKQVCPPFELPGCTPGYPVPTDDDFFVEATSSSGLHVWQDSVEGTVGAMNQLPAPNASVTRYHAIAEGTIVIRATQPGDAFYAPAPPVLIAIQVTRRPAPKPACDLFPPPKPGSQTIAQIDLPGIITLLGNPTPFALAAQGANNIFIYSTRIPLTAGGPRARDEEAILNGLPARIAVLLGRTTDSLGVTATKPFTVELEIPHAQALGDLAAKLGTLNYSQFTIADVGTHKVRITSPTQPDCDLWKSFLTDVRDLTWGLRPESPVSRLFYLANSDVPSYIAAPDVANAFVTLAGGGGGPASVSGSGSPSGSGPPNASGGAAGGGGGGGSGAGTGSPAAGGAASGGASSAASPSNATISIAQPPGSMISVKSDTTPCVAAGLATSNSNACAPAPAPAAPPASGGPAGSSAASPPQPKPLAMASLGTDQLIFSTTNPGDDAAIVERERMLALLDLPRPEMILNGWVMQNSTSSSQAMGEFNSVVKDAVNEFNEALDNVSFRGWASLKKQMSVSNFFEPAFYHYIADHFVADTNESQKPADAAGAAQAFLVTSRTTLADPRGGTLSDFGVCDRGKYCLGYTDLFSPVKPRLTDLLLTIAAAQDPRKAAEAAIDTVENVKPSPDNPFSKDCCKPKPEATTPSVAPSPAPQPSKGCCESTTTTTTLQSGPQDCCQLKTIHDFLEKVERPQFCNNMDETGGAQKPKNDQGTKPEHDKEAIDRGRQKAVDRESHEECNSVWTALDLSRAVNESKHVRSCESNDILLSFASDFPANRIGGTRRHMFLECFRELIQLMLQVPSSAMLPPSAAGLLRADIANFLFNYKVSQQYPHEFEPYYLGQSADTLNAALNPLIEAFNRDVNAFQRYLHADIEYKVDRLNREHDQRCCVKRLFGLDKPSFFNDGMVTVRTISGQWTSVLTASQSFVNASTAPQLSTILNSLPGSAPAAGAAAATGGAAALPQTLANIASAYQTTFAQIGRSLSITALPRSLASASSAEIVVSLNADDSAPPTYYGGPLNGTPANLSRVSQHDTSTRIRVESTKLFEVSSFSAVLQKSQSRFPLIPPFVEIPYIGTIAGIPLPSAKEFHASTAIMSAIVVPTAADLAYGLDFLDDKVVVGDSSTSCSYRQGAGADNAAKVCRLRSAVSLRDLTLNGQAQPIELYNRAIVNCFATDMNSPYSSIKGFNDVSRSACQALSLDQIPQDVP